MKTSGDFRVVLFEHDYVGRKVLEFFIEEHREDLCAVVLLKDNVSDQQYLLKSDFPSEMIFDHTMVKEARFLELLRDMDPHHLILGWWPYIIKEPILSMSQRGIINFHPSLLPYNRGKDPNFWSLVEETPFGVTLQVIDASIDGGDVIFQEQIKTGWTDTGKTLYLQARERIISMFISNYADIREGRLIRQKQVGGTGVVHYRKELEPASEIKLDRLYTGKELLNLLRARTFPPYPGCYFFSEGRKYQVRIEITESEDEGGA